MTHRLEEAFRAAAALSPAEQDALAEVMLAEVDGEAEWDKRLANAQETLAALGEEALEDYREGRTERLDPDKL